MKILKYTFFPLKILLVLLIFVALIYYRTVIFHSNITEPVDYVMSLVEDKFEINIPVYTAKPRLGRFVDKPAGDSVADVNNSVSSTTIESVDVVIQQSTTTSDLVLQPEDTIDDAVTDIDNDESVIEVTSDSMHSASENSNVKQIDTQNISMMNELSEKINQINIKVDQLFEQNKHVSNSQLPADSSSPKSGQSSIQLVADKQPVTEASADNSSRIINLARQSFWNGNTEQAEKFYLDLSKYEDADPDIYGELGNVYYAQGKWKQAGEAYYEAALRLLELKNKEQASYLLRVIQGLDKDSANKLRQKMSG